MFVPIIAESKTIYEKSHCQICGISNKINEVHFLKREAIESENKERNKIKREEDNQIEEQGMRHQLIPCKSSLLHTFCMNCILSSSYAIKRRKCLNLGCFYSLDDKDNLIERMIKKTKYVTSLKYQCEICYKWRKKKVTCSNNHSFCRKCYRTRYMLLKKNNQELTCMEYGCNEIINL